MIEYDGRVAGGARAAILTLLAVGAAQARGRVAAAGELDLDVVGARAIGRAGTQTVSGDGGAALVVNPAGLARRPETRVQVGVALHDDDARYRVAGAAAADSPTVADRGPSVAAPMVAAHVSAGPVVLGLLLIELGALERRMPVPDADQPPADVGRLFPHRYGGLEVDVRRRAAVAGAAMRVGEWLGLGASAGVSEVEVAERRRIWAGFGAIDEIGEASHDVDLSLSARDRLVPMASVGALAAPPELPIELGVAVAWSADAWAHGEAAVGRASSGAGPAGTADAGDAQVRIGGATTLRGGLRYLGQRVAAEVGADMVWYREDAKLPEWRLRDVLVQHESGATADLARIDSLMARRNHSVVRAAFDVEAVAGLLWLTAGYAHATAATATRRLAPAFGDTGGHTLALGAEAAWNQITFTLGIARTISPDVRVTETDTDVSLVNPFDAGSAPAAAGRHHRAHDAIGLSIEVAWD